MPNSQIATRIAEKLDTEIFHEIRHCNYARKVMPIIDAELAPVREALEEALRVSEATEGGGYRMINQPLRAAIKSMEVK